MARKASKGKKWKDSEERTARKYHQRAKLAIGSVLQSSMRICFSYLIAKNHNFAYKNNPRKISKVAIDLPCRFSALSLAILAPYKEVLPFLAILPSLYFTSFPRCSFLPFLAILSSPSFSRCPSLPFLAILLSPSFPRHPFLSFLA